jgi:phosphoenolpyruvate phosphomutase
MSRVQAMQRTSKEIFEAQSLVDVEKRVASVNEVFRLQRNDELEQAELRYFTEYKAQRPYKKVT